MFVLVINSKDNPRIKEIVSIMENRKNRYKDGLFVAEGLRFCKDAILSNVIVRSVYLSEEFISKHPDETVFFEKNCSNIFEISENICKKIGSTVNSQGIFCLCEMPQVSNDLTGNKYIVLENLSDPGNVGTIIRTAEAFGISGVILVGNCVDIYSPKVLRSTMGTIFRIPIYKFENITELKKQLALNNIALYGAVLDNKSKKLSEISFKNKIAIAIGNEANGLSDDAICACDHFIFIEMNGGAESLNAAVAASIIMWEMQKN